MADETPTTAKVKTPKIMATLVKGQVYYLGEKRFDFGVPVEVTDAEREHLEEHGVNQVTDEDGYTDYKQKFRFGGEDDEQVNADAPAARTRPTRPGVRQRPE